MRLTKIWIACCAALVSAAGLMSTAGPASAGVSADVRKACTRKADAHQPPLRAPEREAFIANCLANATAGSGKKN